MKRLWTYLTGLLLFTLPYSSQANAQSYYDSECCTESCGGFEVYGDYLYWKPVQEQMQYAALVPDFRRGFEPIPYDGFSFEGKGCIVEPEFDWNSGFRIGVGYQTPCADWDIRLEWTRFHENVSSSFSSEKGNIFPLANPTASLFGIINNPYTGPITVTDFQLANEAKSHWDFKFDTIDLEIGKACKVCPCLAVRPFVGVKAAWIKQDQHIAYFGFDIEGLPLSITNKKKNHFRAIGPSIGVDAAWEFAPQWSLSSGVSGAWLYGKFDIHQRPEIALDSSFIAVNHGHCSNKHRLRPMVDAFVGIDWASCIYDNWQIGIGVAYEVQYWWNQWHVPAAFLTSLVNGGNSPQGDLMMQGLTVRASVLF